MFKGPVFVIGFPRSGTKLLRDLLNRNPRVSIPEAESQFIPYFVRKYGMRPRFDQGDTFARFCDAIEKSAFIAYMRERGYSFDPQALGTKLDDWSSIFEHLLRYYGPKCASDGVLFGDKTPEYLRAMRLLKDVFPNGRFVHIIRDPRDCCLSAAKAWGLHPYGTADRWHRTLRSQRKVGRSIGDYVEILYEELISDTEQTLRSVCRFLECEFVPDMLSLSKSNENAGDARGRTDVVTDNMNKFWKGFSEPQIRRIEEIALDQMIDLGYEVYLARKPKPLNGVMGFALRWKNSLSFLQAKTKTQGLKEGAKHLLSRGMRRV